MAVLITPEELHALLPSVVVPLVVLDARWSLAGPPGRGEYDAGHIPGASFCDLETVLSGPKRADGTGGRHPIPAADDFELAMRELGVSTGSTVVVYDGDGGYAAARAWWCLRFFGHEDVRYLDGGLRAWRELGLPVSIESPDVEPGDFTAKPGGMALLDADAAAALAREGVLMDARAASRYRGEGETMDPVAGHIPGAVSAQTVDNVEPGKGFHSAELLRARFEGLGVDGSRPVGVYCGSGVSAAQEVLALELAGFDAALYLGSWSDWISDASRPIATGSDAG